MNATQRNFYPQSDNYRPLPLEVLNLCEHLSAPPRLVAHLILVHDVACILSEQIPASFPNFAVDWKAVRFGAASHDIGKAIHRNELAEPGKEHESRGVALLQENGVSEEQSRFAFTHGNWDSPDRISLEDLLVALADNCWKGKRVDTLEAKIVNMLSVASGKPLWACYAELDEIIDSLAQKADERLAWQNQFSPK